MENKELKAITEKSDKSILFMKRLLLAVTIVFCVAFIITGIVFWANSKETEYLYGIGEYTKTNGLYVALGFVFSFGGTFISIITYKISLFILWTAFDIKLIRNKLYNIPNSEPLNKFADSQSNSGDFSAR